MIQLKTFSFNNFQVTCLVCFDPSGACIIVDPGCYSPAEQEVLASFIEAHSLKPQAVVNTHGHIDHILGVDFCLRRWKIPFMLHPGDLPLVRSAPSYAEVFGFELPEAPVPTGFLEHGQEIRIGETVCTVLHVPGHSPGSVALYFPEAAVLITGDALFSRSIGRTDLPGGDADTLLASIREKLLVLPGKTVVWPGHGPSTSIAEEQQENPFLQ